MSDHAYSFYCKENYWQRCDEENLEVVEVLFEEWDTGGDLTRKEVIWRCRQCGGFYKQQYRATYYPSHLFDTEEGWDITNNYFRIEEPRYKTPGSTLDVPLKLDEARKYGYAGEDRTWKNGRCNFPAQNVELTCRAGDLGFVADAGAPNAWDHLRNKLYRCRRCGEWYLFTPLPPHPQGFFKPSNELFPLETARAYGYEEQEVSLNPVIDESEAAEAPDEAQSSPYLSAGTSLRKRTVETLQVIVQEALVLITQDVFETPYKSNFFCRIPAAWVENGQLKKEFWDKIGVQVFGESWQAETFPGAHYIIKSSETVILDDETVKARNWRETIETDDNLYFFFIGFESGEARKVTAQEFQENVDAYFRNEKDAASSAPPELPAHIPENINELDASLTKAWNEPEKLPAAGEWLGQERSEAAQAQYAYIILKKHFARANLELRKDKIPSSWWSMGWALYLNTDAFMREAKHTEMLKAMFIELVDFCESATGKYFAYHLKELLEKLDDSRQSRGKLVPLLPAKALEQFAEIDRMVDEEYEDYLDRMNQMGY